MRPSSHVFLKICVVSLWAATAAPAAEDRIREAVVPARFALLPGQLSPRLRTGIDRGPVDPAMPIRYATLYFRPADGLEIFLADQQNPSSPNFHKWLTPEQFGDRFGLSGNDVGQVTAWLRASGFTIHDIARGRGWITFSATAARVSAAFHTEIHSFLVGGVPHFANSTDLSIPAALAPVIAGVGGLTDFHLQPMHRQMAPSYTNPVGAHYLAPDDLATIYDLAPLYQAGIDGSGQKIAIVGESDVSLSSVAGYRSRFGLPPNIPQVVLYGADPGVVSGAQTEAYLDLEIAGAVARNATLIYVNGGNVNIAAEYAVDQNLAPVISMSYGGCEFTDTETQTLRSVAWQANAQGITWAISSGDSAAATCDRDSPTPQATKGKTVSAPASFPEVTAVGGAEFNEGANTYWNATNSASLGSALSYIPERVWNDSTLVNALAGGGGGASAFFTKPVWQTGPGVPNDGARDLPDVAFAASADHDGFDININGTYYIYGGTSASAPLFAGIVALLNQSQAKTNPSVPVGLGNINAALYRLAQATTDVFHDIVTGDNIVPCAQGSPDCVNGTLGYAAAPGYDQGSGLGSLDAARFIAEWNAGTASTTTLSASPANFAVTDTVQLTATVTGAGPAPTGSVTFVAGDVMLGNATLTPGGKASTAAISVSGLLIAGGNPVVGAIYSGDSNYVVSGGTTTVALKLQASGSLVIPSVTPNPVTQLGSVWPYQLRLSEMAGVATRLTAFTINGVNNLSAFAATGIPANGSLYASLSGSGISVPLNRTFQFAGQDSNGATWQQSLVVPFIAPSGPVRIPGIALSVSPSTMQRNPLAAASCQWSQQVTVQETGGYQTTLSAFGEGSAILTSALPTLFGTTRLAPWGLLTGTACYATANVPSQATYSLSGVAETSGTVTASAVASFAAQSAGPATFSTSVPAVSISAPAGSAGLGLNFTGGSPAWTATVIPASRTWLTLSATAGSGNATLQLNASASGLSNGVYNAIVSIQAQDAIPQSIQVPVNFTVGGSSNVSIAGIGNAASGTQAFAPGQLIAVYGSNLSAASAIAGIQPLPLILSTASATVDGVAAPLWFVSPTQINLQIPYETSAGPAVLAINNGGQIASYSFTVQPAAPGIFAFNGSLVPYATGQPGQTVVAFITGDGDVTPSLATGATPSSSDTLAQLPKSRQPLTLTVGGEQATVVFDGIVPGLIGVTQVNFTIPADAKTGVLPVVATVGGVSGAPVNLTVTGGVSSSQQGRAFSLSPLVF